METRRFIHSRYGFLLVLFIALVALLQVTPAYAADPIGFDPPIPFDVDLTPYGVAVGDFNRDGYPDLVTANNASNNASILINVGTGAFLPPANKNSGTSPWGVVAGDFDGDGYDDFAVTNNGSDSVSVFLNTGTASFAEAVNYPLDDGAEPRWDHDRRFQQRWPAGPCRQQFWHRQRKRALGGRRRYF